MSQAEELQVLVQRIHAGVRDLGFELHRRELVLTDLGNRLTITPRTWRKGESRLVTFDVAIRSRRLRDATAALRLKLPPDQWTNRLPVVAGRDDDWWLLSEPPREDELNFIASQVVALISHAVGQLRAMMSDEGLRAYWRQEAKDGWLSPPEQVWLALLGSVVSIVPPGDTEAKRWRHEVLQSLAKLAAAEGWHLEDWLGNARGVSSAEDQFADAFAAQAIAAIRSGPRVRSPAKRPDD